MLETKKQKQYFFTTVVLILILAIITACSRGGFKFTENNGSNTATSTPDQVAAARAYLAYLRQTKTDPVASKQFFQEIVNEADIKQEVENDFQINQPIAPPVIDEKAIKVTNDSGQQAVVDYLNSTVAPALSFNNSAATFADRLFQDNGSSAASIASAQDELMAQLKGVAVPKEALAMHKAYLTVLEQNKDVLNLAAAYSSGQNSDPWSKLYHDNAIILDASTSYSNELNKLDKKYQLSALPALKVFAESQKNSGNMLIPTAHAFLGITFNTTIGDVPRLIIQAVQAGLTSAFAQYLSSYLIKLAQKIENNYRISNFLYYSDALIAGQYSGDYLKKYVDNQFDRDVIMKMIPQFSCGNVDTAQMESIFKAKATDYLGFDPSTVNPSDPDFALKMAKAGSFLAQPAGWQEHYEEVAQAAQSAADKAAQLELTSGGLKTPRNAADAEIVTSVNTLLMGEGSGLKAIFDTSIRTSDNLIGAAVAKLSEQFFSSFLFGGVTVNNQGQIGVLREQSTCISPGQMVFVIPPDSTQYNNPPPAPTADQIIQDLCDEYGATACPPQTGPGSLGETDEEQPIELFTDPGR